MTHPINILERYWNFTAFRPLQEEIIQAVIDNEDTFALLPTGGGKSVCFQVPALAQDGICIVISPLIALMKDQVDHLVKRNISAVAIYSGMHYRDIDRIFDNCAYGEIKFLYMSPERLTTDLAIERIKKMNVSLLAVDEAHCISQWGYDFRPPYLRIAEIREWLPDVPILALTATATPEVVTDIQDKLAFKKKNILQKSFSRNNVAYVVLEEEDKNKKLLDIVKNVKGTGIVYAANRKATKDVATFLQKNNISSDFYHAGLSSEVRSIKQDKWIKGQIRVMACTNAFGMGIDKPDVRFVIHVDIPDTLENYYQECGRGGRDGNKAFAVSVLGKKDISNYIEKSVQSFPSKDEIKRVYEAMSSFLRLAIGSGKDETFVLDIETMCKNYNLDIRQVILSLKFVEREGYILFNESSDYFSSVIFKASYEQVYNFRTSQHRLSWLVDALLRSYSRLFDETSSISEWTLAKRTKWSKDNVIKGLEWLHNSEYIIYNKASNLPKITFTCERLDKKNLSFSDAHYKLRKEVTQNKSEAMLHYVQSEAKCRSRMLLEYFGELDAENCGMCDYCLKQL
jgi:ATP-dependent DNA helicase RecQ